MTNSEPLFEPSKALWILDQLKAEASKRQAERRLTDYRPYAKQKAFHDAGATHRERLFLAGNRCLTPWTALQTGLGERLVVETLGAQGFDIRSWDGSSRCTRHTSSVFLRGIEPAFQIHLDNGEVFQCSHRHRVFANGWMGAHHLSGWVSIDRLIRGLDAGHWIRTDRGWKASCDEDAHLHDARPLRGSNSGHLPLPRQCDVPNIAPLSSLGDAKASIASHSHAYRERGLLSTLDEESLLADLCGQISVPVVSSFCLPSIATYQSARLSVHESVLAQAEWEAEVLQRLRAYPEVSSVLLARNPVPILDGNRILAVIPLGYQPIVDFEVEETHQYVAAGIRHHNCGKTQAGAYELAMHLTGEYPDWWSGKRFDKPVRAWAAGVTSESTRDVVQEKLFGPPDRRESWGTGAIPKASIGDIMMGRGIANGVDMASIKHASGEWSSVAFKSYEKGREKWQGAALEVIWMDEEMTDASLYYEALTRTNETGGIVYMTCTPLFGMSGIMRMFLMGG